MADDLRAGDRVSWNTSQGRTRGRVVKKLTSDITIDDFHVTASVREPKYLVESEKTGKRAAHRPSALHRLQAKKT
jgi:hypothetical protein